MGIQLLQHKFVQHGGREQRLLVAKGLPDKDQSHHGLAAGVQPQGVQSVQRLLAGLVQRQVQQKAAVVLPAALVGKEVGVAAGVQTVKALVQRKAGAELGQAGGAVLAARVVSRRESRYTMMPSAQAKRQTETTAFMERPSPKEFSLL